MKKNLLGLLLLLTACSSALFRPNSVFGPDLPYRTDSQDKDVLIYRNPKIKATAYSKFLIDPIQIISNESSGHGIRPEEEKLIKESFREEIVRALQGYTIVDKPGPGVLRIRSAILDIQPAHLELDEEKFIVMRLDTLLARVSMELACVDAQSGEPVVALIHTLPDRKYMDKNKKIRLLNICEAFSEWTQSLRARFDTAKFKPTSDLDGLDREENRRLHFEEGE